MSVLSPNSPDRINPEWVGLLDSRLSGWFIKETDELFRGFAISSEDRVLDVGCGPGTASWFCAVRGAHITFVDIDEKNIQLTEKRLQKQGTASGYQGIVSDGNPLPLPDGDATRVICQEVLEHVADPAKFMHELVRVGAPGALYLLTVPGEAGELVQKPFAPPGYFEHPNHIRVFSQQSFSELAESAGLEIVEYASAGFYRTFWVCLQWAVAHAKKRETGDDLPLIADPFTPPYDDILHEWATLWGKLISTPEGEAFKQQLDQILPKVQIILGRKR